MSGVQTMDEAGSERNRSGPEWPNRLCMDGFDMKETEWNLQKSQNSWIGRYDEQSFFGWK